MKKVIVILVLIAVLVLGYLVAGPFLTIRAIRKAVEAQDTAALSEHVDFALLRANVKARIEDRLARSVGDDAQSSLLGALAVRIAGGLTDTAVDAMVTPAGIGAMIEGRGLLHRISGGGIDPNDSSVHVPPSDPLEGADYGFESPSRFTATVQRGGGPVVVELSRQGLRWKVTDIRVDSPEG